MVVILRVSIRTWELSVVQLHRLLLNSTWWNDVKWWRLGNNVRVVLTRESCSHETGRCDLSMLGEWPLTLLYRYTSLGRSAVPYVVRIVKSFPSAITLMRWGCLHSLIKWRTVLAGCKLLVCYYCIHTNVGAGDVCMSWSSGEIC
jgi:hypothetical protein